VNEVLNAKDLNTKDTFCSGSKEKETQAHFMTKCSVQNVHFRK